MTFLNMATNLIYRFAPATLRKTDYGTVHLIINNIYASLRHKVPKKKAYSLNPYHTVNSNNYSVRPCLYTSVLSYKRGSITIEAALGFPLFLFAILSFMFILNIIYIQLTLQTALEETARSLSKTAYITSEFYDLSSDQQNEFSDDSDLVSTLSASLLSVPMLEKIFIDDHMRHLLDNSIIKNGADGVSFIGTTVNMDTQQLDLVLNYDVTIPFIPADLFSFQLVNRCFIRIYTGEELATEQQKSTTYLYYTSSGSVMHTDKYCQYLLNYSKALPFLDFGIDSYILPCMRCTQDITEYELRKNNSIIYLNSEESVYHTTLDCPSFTGQVFRIEVDNPEDYHICEECLKGI